MVGSKIWWRSRQLPVVNRRPNPANWTPVLALVGLSRIWSDSNHPYWIIRGSTLQTYKVDNTDKAMEEKVCSITLHWQSGPHGILAVQIAT
jgi:hypothetical protein